MIKKDSNKKVIRVGIFQWCISHYRLGIFRALQRRDDMEFTICAPDNIEADFRQTKHKEKGFPFVDIKSWRLKMPLIKKTITLQPYLVWSLITRRFDVIIMPNDFFDICVWINVIFGRFFGCKVCLWGQATVKRFKTFSNILRKIIMQLAHAVIFYDKNTHDKWNSMGFPSEKLFVAYNSLDTHKSFAIKARQTEEDLTDFRREQNLEGKKVVLFCGRLQYRKKSDVIVRAMKEVLETVPNAHAVIIGDGPMRQPLKQLIDDLDVADALTLAGPIHDEDVLAKYFLCSRAAIMPASAGLAIQHAFGYGVPIIVGDAMSTHGPEIGLVVDGKSGLYCRDENIGEFKEAICKLLTDDVLQQELAKNAYRVIEEKYNIDNMTVGFFNAVTYCMNM